MNELILTIKGAIHPSLNDWHQEFWAENIKEKDDWKWMVRAAIGKNLGIGPFHDIYIEYHVKDNIHRDKDNYAPKFILDALKCWGLIKSDAAQIVKVDWGFKFSQPEKKTVIILRK